METAIESCKDENVVYDGFIRNDWNIDVFNEILPSYQVVLFELSEEKAKQRLLGRMFNPKTGETFPAGTIIDPKT
jgi:adenylate kinase